MLVYRIAGRGRASGVPLEHDFGIVWRLQDGKLVDGETHADPDDALDAAGIRRSLGAELRHLGDYGAAVEAGDFDRMRELLHPDVVWEHNLGSGSVEEGTYEGNEAILALFDRIIEVWESMRPRPRTCSRSRTGIRVRGELHTSTG